MAFELTDLDRLSDGVVDLVVEEREPADPTRGYVPCYHYRIFPHGSALRVGEIRLRVGRVETHPTLLTAGHIGYEVDEAHRGHGYAARACALLAPVALAHGLRRLVITCDPDNAPSRRTCERVGAVLVGVFDVPPDHPMYQKGRRKVCRYVWSLPGPRGPSRPSSETRPRNGRDPGGGRSRA